MFDVDIISKFDFWGQTDAALNKRSARTEDIYSNQHLSFETNTKYGGNCCQLSNVSLKA